MNSGKGTTVWPIEVLLSPYFSTGYMASSLISDNPDHRRASRLRPYGLIPHFLGGLATTNPGS